MGSHRRDSSAIRRLVLCVALGGAATPATAVDMRWTNSRDDGSGTFSVASNWTSANPMVSPPPGASDVARFGRSTSSLALAYTVNFTNDPTNLRLVVEDDNATFDLNGNGYRATSPIAVMLGTEAGRTGRLTVIDGNLNTPTTADIQIATVAGGAAPTPLSPDPCDLIPQRPA